MQAAYRDVADKLADGMAVQAEFSRLQNHHASVAYAISAPHLTSRNRYRDVLPYDDSRIVLASGKCCKLCMSCTGVRSSSPAIVSSAT